MKRILSVFTLIIIALNSTIAMAQETEPRYWEADIRNAMDSLTADRKIPGLVIVVADSNGIVISEAIGTASLSGPTPMTRSTMMRMGVFGDLGINMALLRLSDMGKLDLDAPISQYADVHPALGRVTANQLVSHKAGLRAHHFNQPLWEDADLSRKVQSWDEDIFVAEPGEARSHSHYSIALAGYLVESITGKPFADAMRELVWDPIGAPAATTSISKLLLQPIGQGYSVTDGEPHLIEPLGEGFIGWPNSLFASLNDMDKIALELAKPETGGRLRGDRATNSPWFADSNWGGINIYVVVDPERRFSALIAENGYGSEAAIWELSGDIWIDVLGQQPYSPSEVEWTAVSADKYDQLVGIYENETRFEIAVRDGKLMMISGPSTEEIMQGGDNLFRAPLQYVPNSTPWPSNFSVEALSEGKARLLRIGSRVWKRQQL